MDIFEKVEKIVEKTGVSYEDAKAALQESGGDMLDAMIILEKQHKTGEKKTAFYSTGDAMESKADEADEKETGEVMSRAADNGSRESRRKERRAGMDNFRAEVKRLFQLSIRNRFVVQRKGETLIAVPTLALVILLICVFWFTLILLVVGLFLGCRYSFEFTGKAADTVNEFLGKAADTAETIKKDFSQDNSQEKDN